MSVGEAAQGVQAGKEAIAEVAPLVESAEANLKEDLQLEHIQTLVGQLVTALTAARDTGNGRGLGGLWNRSRGMQDWARTSMRNFRDTVGESDNPNAQTMYRSVHDVGETAGHVMTQGRLVAGSLGEALKALAVVSQHVDRAIEAREGALDRLQEVATHTHITIGAADQYLGDIGAADTSE
jgi:hypothetical protein